MVQTDLACVPRLMSGEQALAAQIGGSVRVPRLAPSLSVMSISTLPLWRHRSGIVVDEAPVDATGERLGCGVDDLG